mgnify:CR=1 FL=1
MLNFKQVKNLNKFKLIWTNNMILLIFTYSGDIVFCKIKLHFDNLRVNRERKKVDQENLFNNIIFRLKELRRSKR